MRVDKCPNCGAFLPAPAPGQTRVRCEYCHTEARTTTHVQVQAPPQGPLHVPRQGPPPRPANIGARVALAIAFVAIAGIVSALVVLRNQPGFHPGRASTSQTSMQTTDQLDVSKGLADATARATGLAGDALLVGLSAPFVRPDGVADLTLGSSSVSYHFRSPSRSKAAADRPIGSEVRLECGVYVVWGRSYQTATLSGGTVEQCQEPVVKPPTCTLPEVWQRAFAAGAPRNAVASIDYEASTRDAFWRSHSEGLLYDPSTPVEGVWTLAISDNGKTLFRKSFPDDCDGAPAAAPRPASFQVHAAIQKMFPGDSTLGMWTCTARAGISRAHVKAHLVVPAGGSPSKVSDVVVSAPGARGKDDLIKCFADRIAAAPLPAPGVPTELDIEFDAAH